MLYKKTVYLLMGLLLVLSLKVAPSVNDQRLWHNLQYQQSDMTQIKNAVGTFAEDCAPACCLSVVGCAVFSVFCPTTVGACDFPPFLQLQLPPSVLASRYLAFALSTLRQECYDKPEQAKTAQEQLEKKIMRSYTFKDIKRVFNENDPFFLAMQKRFEKME